MVECDRHGVGKIDGDMGGRGQEMLLPAAPAAEPAPGRVDGGAMKNENSFTSTGVCEDRAPLPAE